MNPVKVGFFSLTSGAVDGDDDTYLAWHLLDHQPEQYSITGVRLATRWRADEECRSLRWLANDALSSVRHVVAYLMTDPIDATLVAFAQLGKRAAETGRFPMRATSHLLGAYHLQNGYASPRVLVSAEAIPFRAHCGVVLVVEAVGEGDVAAWARWHHAEHVPALLRVPGVAGVYTFRNSSLIGIGGAQGERYAMPAWDPGDRFVTVVYVDDDVATTTRRLEPIMRARWEAGAVTPELAGPFRSMVSHVAWPDAGPAKEGLERN